MQVYIDNRLGDANGLVSFTDTIVVARDAYPDCADYRPDARLPVGFRELDEQQLEKYTAPLEELTIESELDFIAVFRPDPETDDQSDFSPFFSLSPVVALPPSVDEENRPSITVDPESGLRMGLHLDTWDELDLAARWKSRNRIVVNKGPATRYVYVIPVPIEAMATCLASTDGIHPCEIADRYMAANPNVPCLRIRQSTDVAYVCCTERLVHDACKGQNGRMTESRHYLGHFVKNQRCPLPLYWSCAETGSM